MAGHSEKRDAQELPFIVRTAPRDDRVPNHALRHYVVFTLLFWVAIRIGLEKIPVYLPNVYLDNSSSEPVGTVHWGACHYPDALPNAECGYIM